MSSKVLMIGTKQLTSHSSTSTPRSTKDRVSNLSLYGINLTNRGLESGRENYGLSIFTVLFSGAVGHTYITKRQI